ncbi:alpha/beta fold hydrolase [Anaeromicropila populeti]|uniref:Uncharacterized protein n=1 Tax=Anaeromicropila populeti TaxID=37658 RepID=A0A1I6HJ34_9FIRM|nr:alpha/beta hydrolase [Anaeromicropila populeti]SFR54502.1 hypothetical protein SAMN05661086_00033 [Anaeromicropila populeti]
MDKICMNFGKTENVRGILKGIAGFEREAFHAALKEGHIEGAEAGSVKPSLFGIEIDFYDFAKMVHTFAVGLEEVKKEYGTSPTEAELKDDWIADIHFEKTQAAYGERTLSGLVINPYPQKKKPLFLYTHATQLKKSLVPSSFFDIIVELKEDIENLIKELMEFEWNIFEYIKHLEKAWKKLQETQLADHLEVIFLIFFAMEKGYSVVMPDYPGMGMDSKAEHPYVVAENLTDTICRFAESVIVEQKKVENWNNELYVGGYSQGGYVAMVVTEGISKSTLLKDSLKKSWPAGGPYSLSEAMRKLMIADADYFCLFFLPLTIRAFYYCCGENKLFSPESAFGENGEAVFKYVDGSVIGSEADKGLLAFTDGKKIPSKLLTPELKELLSDPNGDNDVIRVLIENNGFATYPKELSKITTLFHHQKDPVVPYENAVIAQEHLNVKIEGLEHLLEPKNMNKHILGFVHYMLYIAAKKY